MKMSLKSGSKRLKRSYAKNQEIKPKRVKFAHDDEIQSDSDEEVAGRKEDSLQEDSDIEETAQEKKLRLTKKYLEELKNLKSQESDEEDSVGVKLQEDVLEQAGKLQKNVADKCSKPDFESLVVRRGHKLSVTCLVLSSDGLILFSASKDCCIIKWDATDMKKLGKITGGHRNDPNLTHTAHIYSLAISTDNEFLVSGGVDKMIHVWGVKSCEHLHKFQGHRGPVSGLAFRRNAHQLFSSSHDRCVKVWDLDAMGYVETLFGHQDAVQAIDSLTRERCITAGGRDGSARIWKIVEESQLVFHGHFGSIDCIKLINEEHFISGSDDGSICVWSVMKKKPIVKCLQAHPGANGESSWITAVAALVSSDLIASGSSNGKVKLWKCGPKCLTIELLFEVPVEGFINSLQFSPLGDKLFVGVGQEHRLGRWWTLKQAKNSIVVIPLQEINNPINK